MMFPRCISDKNKVCRSRHSNVRGQTGQTDKCGQVHYNAPFTDVNKFIDKMCLRMSTEIAVIMTLVITADKCLSLIHISEPTRPY